MMLGDYLKVSQDEHELWLQVQADKCGDYVEECCLNCGRQRVMTGTDGKHRCEKCCWCLEDLKYDGDLVDYMH